MSKWSKSTKRWSQTFSKEITQLVKMPSNNRGCLNKVKLIKSQMSNPENHHKSKRKRV